MRALLARNDPEFAAALEVACGPAHMAKYSGVLAAADIKIFVSTTAFAILQSMRLDLGPSSPVRTSG